MAATWHRREDTAVTASKFVARCYCARNIDIAYELELGWRVDASCARVALGRLIAIASWTQRGVYNVTAAIGAAVERLFDKNVSVARVYGAHDMVVAKYGRVKRWFARVARLIALQKVALGRRELAARVRRMLAARLGHTPIVRAEEAVVTRHVGEDALSFDARRCAAAQTFGWHEHETIRVNGATIFNNRVYARIVVDDVCVTSVNGAHVVVVAAENVVGTSASEIAIRGVAHIARLACVVAGGVRATGKDAALVKCTRK